MSGGRFTSIRRHISSGSQTSKITLTDLELRIKDTVVLTVQSMDIVAGDWLHVWGNVGEGQSWLVKVLTGAVPFHEDGDISGDISWFGLKNSEASLKDIGQLVGYVGTDPADHLVALRVRDELEWASSLASDRKSPAADIFLEFAQISSLGDQEVRTLSSGQRQRVALASCLAAVPRAVMLVDAYSTLDEATRIALARFAEQYTKDEGGIFVNAALIPSSAEMDRATPLRACGSSVVFKPESRGPNSVDWLEPENNNAFLRQQKEHYEQEPIVEELKQLLTRENHNGQCEPLSCSRTKVYAEHGMRLDIEGFQIEPGTTVGLVGSNGSGKTTLLEVLGGLIKIRGKKLDRGPRLGLLWGTVDTPEEHLWIEKPVQISKERLQVSEVLVIRRRFEWLLACAKANIRYLLLDEPTLGMDDINRKLLLRFLAEFRRVGVGVVIASHDLQFLAACTNRMTWLDGGQIKADGDTEIVLDEYQRYARGGD